jgi:hypothetical protein
VTYTVCSSSDAGTGAETGDDDGGADAGMCFATCAEACAQLKPSSLPGFGSCTAAVDAGGGATVMASCETLLQSCVGRKLDGLAPPKASRLRSDGKAADASPLGAALAHMAWREAASVHAFHRLARELHAHDAPTHLVRRAQACARDEARNARIMARLAKKHGAEVPHVVVHDTRTTRALEDVACENAVEGCVGETYGALYALWQQGRTDDADLAGAMHAIAPDELRHAALGWAVAAWADTLLTVPARRRVRAARDEAVRALLEQTRATPTGELTRALALQLFDAA